MSHWAFLRHGLPLWAMTTHQRGVITWDPCQPKGGWGRRGSCFPSFLSCVPSLGHESGRGYRSRGDGKELQGRQDKRWEGGEKKKKKKKKKKLQHTLTSRLWNRVCIPFSTMYAPLSPWLCQIVKQRRNSYTLPSSSNSSVVVTLQLL